MLLQRHRSSFSAVMVIALIFVQQTIGTGTADAPVTTLGVWSSSYSSGNVRDPSLTAGNMLTLNINATDLPAINNSRDGGVNAFDITVYYNPAILNATDADFKAPLCPASEGCLFDRSEALSFAHTLNSTLGTVNIASALLGGTTVDGSGTLLRISFKVVGSGSTDIHVGEESILTGPVNEQIMTIPYQSLDGSFDNSPNMAPIAQFAASPQSPSVNQEVTFDASQSFDPDGSIANYSWNFGDVGSATGTQATHRFESTGNYTVTLTVTDNRGATASQTQTVTVTATGNPGGSNTRTNPSFPVSLQTAAIMAAALLIIIAALALIRRRSKK